jgi:hypothetical protein
MDTYLVALEKLKVEGRLHKNTLLPELKIDYPENYAYDDLARNTSYVHTLDSCEVSFPKNATEESLKAAYVYLKDLDFQQVA